MLRIAFLIATLCLPAVAEAQQVTARINWYGVYTAQEKEIEDPKSPTGKRYEITGVKAPSTNVNRITPKANTNFGFSYTVNDGSKGNSIEIEEVYFLPNDGLAARAQETGEPQYKFTKRVNSGEDHTVGWAMADDPDKTPKGMWIIEIHHKGRIIAAQRFFVQPAAATTSNRDR